MRLISPNLKFFFIGFVFSLPIFWGANVFQKNLEDFLFWDTVANDPKLLTAQIIQQDNLEQLKPIRNWQVLNLEISGESAISVFLDSQGKEKILFSKNGGRVLPIASLTKLMTANVVLENYDLSQTIKIAKHAMTEEEDAGYFKIGEAFSAKNLLYSSLIESSNDATLALTGVIGQDAFVDLMNLEAENLGLKNTFFVNPTGLDPDNPKDLINYSTAEDLSKLAVYLLKNKPAIFEISSLAEYNLYSANGVFHHKIKNTDELLGGSAGWQIEIIGSKTGQTPQAGGCLLIVLKIPGNRGEIINVILNSPDRFQEMKKLADWIGKAYKW